MPKILAIACLASLFTSLLLAMDFMEKRECTLTRPGRAGVHTKCLVTGGMQGGTIDVSIKTPDGKKYALEGPTDSENGGKYLLEGSPATNSGECYSRNDRKLSICLGKEVD